MPNANLGSYTFNIDPSTVSWTYRLNTKSFDTYGGKVIQVLSCRVENLQIGGSLSQKGIIKQFDEMKEFESDVLSIMESQAKSKEPIEFNFPAVQWNGQVFLVGYSDVKYDTKTSAVHYTLSMMVDSGFDALKTIDSAEGLDAIPDGVNWVRNDYNDPGNKAWDNMKTALKALLDKSGTFDASNPPSIYSFLEAAEKSNTDAKSTDKASTDKDSSSDSSKDSYKTSDPTTGTATGQQTFYESNFRAITNAITNQR